MEAFEGVERGLQVDRDQGGGGVPLDQLVYEVTGVGGKDREGGCIGPVALLGAEQGPDAGLETQRASAADEGGGQVEVGVGADRGDGVDAVSGEQLQQRRACEFGQGEVLGPDTQGGRGHGGGDVRGMKGGLSVWNVGTRQGG